MHLSAPGPLVVRAVSEPERTHAPPRLPTKRTVRYFESPPPPPRAVALALAGAAHEADTRTFAWPAACAVCGDALLPGARLRVCSAGHSMCVDCAAAAVRAGLNPEAVTRAPRCPLAVRGGIACLLDRQALPRLLAAPTPPAAGARGGLGGRFGVSAGAAASTSAAAAATAAVPPAVVLRAATTPDSAPQSAAPPAAAVRLASDAGSAPAPAPPAPPAAAPAAAPVPAAPSAYPSVPLTLLELHAFDVATGAHLARHRGEWAFVQCPRGDATCGTWHAVSRALAGDAGAPRVCPSCLHRFCPTCARPWEGDVAAGGHAGGAVPCADIRAAAARVADAAAADLLATAAGKRCPAPGCAAVLCKPLCHGCHDVTCTRCSSRVCYCCLQPQGRCACPLLCPPTGDAACDCALCPSCAPARPCADCDGGCPACRVPPETPGDRVVREAARGAAVAARRAARPHWSGPRLTPAPPWRDGDVGGGDDVAATAAVNVDLLLHDFDDDLDLLAELEALDPPAGLPAGAAALAAARPPPPSPRCRGVGAVPHVTRGCQRAACFDHGYESACAACVGCVLLCPVASLADAVTLLLCAVLDAIAGIVWLLTLRRVLLWPRCDACLGRGTPRESGRERGGGGGGAQAAAALPSAPIAAAAAVMPPPLPVAGVAFV